MDQETVRRLLEEMQSQLIGDPARDRETLLTWAKRYRGDEGAHPLLREIGLLLFQLDADTAGPLTEQVMDQILRRREEALSQAREDLFRGQFARAEGILAPILAEIDGISLPEDSLWMDFSSFLDGLLYQDYFSEEIGGREVRRHPLRPGDVLYAYATALLGQNRSEQARTALEQLVQLDPVCPEYLCALADVCLGTGETGEAWEILCWALECASTPEEAAYCYYLLSRCCAARENWVDAAVLLRKSLRVAPLAETEEALPLFSGQAGEGADLSDEAVNRRCRALDVPIGRSPVVEENLVFLASLSS